jgi:hypothetical protein
MKIVPMVDHGVPLFDKNTVITHHVCSRESVEQISSIVIRKFKSSCGNTLEVHVTRRSGYIRSIEPVYTCQVHCVLCREKIEMIRKLIAQEYKRS